MYQDNITHQDQFWLPSFTMGDFQNVAILIHIITKLHQPEVL